MLKFGNRKNDNNAAAAKKGDKSGAALNPQQLQQKKELSAIKVQCLVRRFLARRRIRKQAKYVYHRVYDPVYKKYFWYHRYARSSTWDKPRFVIDKFDSRDQEAAVRIQGLIRIFLAKCRVRRKAQVLFERYFDSETSKFYWLDVKTGKTTYTASPWLQRQEIPLPKEDQLLYQSHLKIKELEKKLGEKEKEIKEIRKQRVEELMPAIIKDKVKNAKNLQRSKHMDTWTTDDLGAWFTELKMEDYISYLYSNRIDGALFINLNEEDFTDMGIANRFHLKKLDLILKSYRIRYQRKKERKHQNRGDGGPETEDEDEDLLSEYAPSELSAIIAAEDYGGGVDDYSDEGSEEVRIILYSLFFQFSVVSLFVVLFIF
jgi:hypothetical protein